MGFFFRLLEGTLGIRIPGQFGTLPPHQSTMCFLCRGRFSARFITTTPPFTQSRVLTAREMSCRQAGPLHPSPFILKFRYTIFTKPKLDAGERRTTLSTTANTGPTTDRTDTNQFRGSELLCAEFFLLVS